MLTVICGHPTQLQGLLFTVWRRSPMNVLDKHQYITRLHSFSSSSASTGFHLKPLCVSTAVSLHTSWSHEQSHSSTADCSHWKTHFLRSLGDALYFRESATTSSLEATLAITLCCLFFSCHSPPSTLSGLPWPVQILHSSTRLWSDSPGEALECINTAATHALLEARGSHLAPPSRPLLQPASRFKRPS